MKLRTTRTSKNKGKMPFSDLWTPWNSESKTTTTATALRYITTALRYITNYALAVCLILICSTALLYSTLLYTTMFCLVYCTLLCILGIVLRYMALFWFFFLPLTQNFVNTQRSLSKGDWYSDAFLTTIYTVYILNILSIFPHH
jgi:hypothetical protein